jgi:chromosome segregation ATPase
LDHGKANKSKIESLFKDAKRDKEIKRERYARLENELRDEHERRNRLDEKLKTQLTELDELDKAIDRLGIELGDTESLINFEKLKIGKFNGVKERLDVAKARLSALNNEAAGISAKIETVRAEQERQPVPTIDEVIPMCTEDIEQRIAETEKMLKVSEDRRCELIAELDGLRNEIFEAESHALLNMEMKQKISILKFACNELSNKHMSRIAEIQMYESLINDAQNERERCQRQLKDAKSRFERGIAPTDSCDRRVAMKKVSDCLWGKFNRTDSRNVTTRASTGDWVGVRL